MRKRNVLVNIKVIIGLRVIIEFSKSNVSKPLKAVSNAFKI